MSTSLNAILDVVPDDWEELFDDGDKDAEVHIYHPGYLELHTDEADCPCGPEIIWKDEETGNKVYFHDFKKEVQEALS